MTFAGKKLQDIYDGASAHMSEMERAVSDSLKNSVKEHIQTRKSSKETSVASLENRSKGLETELRSFMESSMDRVRKTMDEEIKATEEHLGGVKVELKTLSEKLRTTITELKDGHSERMNQIEANLSDHYESVVETTTVDMEKQNFSSMKRLRAHGTLVMNSLQQKLDKSLWESRGEEKQYNSSLFKTFMQKANTIDTHFSTLMQKLSSDFQTHFKVLEGQTVSTEDDLNKSYQLLFEQVDVHADELEKQIQEFFQVTIETHTRTLDASLGTIAHDLSAVHDSTTTKLTDQTRDLSANLVASSAEAREGLSRRCGDLRNLVDERLTTFRRRLDDRVGTTSTLRESLELERRAIFEKTRAELNTICESFERHINTLMTDAVERVKVIEEEAGREINEAQIQCINHLRSESEGSQRQIDQSVEQFLALLAKQRDIALEEIANSASSSSMDEPKVTQPKPKRTKKS